MKKKFQFFVFNVGIQTLDIFFFYINYIYLYLIILIINQDNDLA